MASFNVLVSACVMAVTAGSAMARDLQNAMDVKAIHSRHMNSVDDPFILEKASAGSYGYGTSAGHGYGQEVDGEHGLYGEELGLYSEDLGVYGGDMGLYGDELGLYGEDLGSYGGDDDNVLGGSGPVTETSDGSVSGLSDLTADGNVEPTTIRAIAAPLAAIAAACVAALAGVAGVVYSRRKLVQATANANASA